MEDKGIKVQEMSEEEELLNRLQVADIRLEQLEDILDENRTEEQKQEYLELKNLIKELKLKQKELKKAKKEQPKENLTFWEKLNPVFVIYGIASFILVVYPIGPMLSAYWANISYKIANSINDAISLSDKGFNVINFLLYLIYFLIYIIGAILIYVFSKKNKINLWTFIITIGVIVITSIISVLTIVEVFFQ